MRAILSAPGSRGDVNPMVAIGRHLRSLGFDVVISLAEPYVDVAVAAGLQCEPIIPRDRFEQLLAKPSMWKPIRGARAIFREVVGEYLDLHWDVIRRHHLPGETILVSHPLDLASRVHRDWDPTTPLVDVHLAPSMLRTLDSPPRMTPWPIEATRPRWLVDLAYRSVDRWGIDPVIAPRVNAKRSQLSLPPIRRVIDRWWLSPDRVLAMYPDWYAPATIDWDSRLVHCGFPLDDAVDSKATSPLPDNRPVAFTGGTAHHHSRRFFAVAAAACQSLEVAGLLISTHQQNFPAGLPPNVSTCGYVSFSDLLPVCRAIVHHGGIGTTSQSIAAGIPQLIRPMAFDQFDNATRVQQLNCGDWLRSDRDLPSSLARLLADDSIRQSCDDLMRRMPPNAARTAAYQIRDTLQNFPT